MISRLFENPLNVFISYKEIIKQHNFFIIKKIFENKNVYNQLSNYINLNLFDHQSDERINMLLLNRDKENLLEYLKIKEFNYEVNYNKLYKKFPEMFINSYPLEMLNVINRFNIEEFIKNIYIYNEEEDIRMIYDIKNIFPNTGRIKFVSGNYFKCIESIEVINIFIDNNLERLSEIIKSGKFNNSTFLIARYGYNYEIKDNIVLLKYDMGKFVYKNKINLVEFYPLKITYDGIFNG